MSGLCSCCSPYAEAVAALDRHLGDVIRYDDAEDRYFADERYPDCPACGDYTDGLCAEGRRLAEIVEAESWRY